MTFARGAPLVETERAALNRVVGSLRAVLTRELRRALEGTYGIRFGRSDAEDEARLSLDPDQLVARRELVGVWEALGGRADLLVREAAFTHANRLIAVRVAEALGLLPESIARGRRSSGFRQVLEVAPLLGSDDDAGYWTYLQLCGDELAHDVPRLFDPRNPLLALRPPPAVIDDLVGLIAPDELGEAHDEGSAWGAPDALGWTYQFFNSDEERAEMRRQHAQPVDSWELAVRNQFFTPDYVVGFLVHNSLGRRLIEAGFHELAQELAYLVDPPVAAGSPLDLNQVRVLDPAVGSGHFLLGAYDVLERAWELRGVAAAEAAPAIVGSLWGIDIDARAAQVAAAAIIFRARRHRADGDLPAPNVICARAIPGGPAARAALVASVEANQRDFLAELIRQLDGAPELGSLLRIEDLLTGELARRMAFGGGRERAARRGSAPPPQSLIDAGIEAGVLDVTSLVNDVLSHVQADADQLTSTPAERVLAADGGDAMRFVEAVSQRYDAVLMNPPFGEPIPATKPYLKTAYPWLPTRDANLFAAFVGRGMELCNDDGYLGAITSRAGMFLTTFQSWRKEVLLGNDLTVLADLGHKVMHDALVEAAAYVIRHGRTQDDRSATFIRLLRELPDRRPEALRGVCARLRAGTPDERVFHVTPAAFNATPGAPVSYWMGPDIRRLFTEFPPLDGHGADVRVGLQTGDDFRFVRAFWEIDPASIARSREETFEGRRWVPFAKGGEYSPFWSDIHLVVDFERDGEQLRSFPGSVIRNPQFYFRLGITWPRRTASGFSPRILPEGCVFADKGPAAIAYEDPLAVLGWLASRTAGAMLAVQLGAADETSGGGASKSYEVGLVAKLPWPTIFASDERLKRLAREIALTRRGFDLRDETSRGFLAPWPHHPTGNVHAAVEARLQAYEEDVVSLVDLSAELETAVLAGSRAASAAAFVAQEMGAHPGSLARSPLPTEEANRLFGLPLDRVIEFATERRGALRVLTQKNFVADRRIEVIAHAFEVHPREVVSARRTAGAIPPEYSEESLAGVFSYLVGCAFGRWDARIGRDPSSAPSTPDDPFMPVPVCPPGTLVGRDGLPAREAPSGYPLRLSDHRVLVDENGHHADAGDALEAAAAALVDRPAAMLEELAQLLGAPDVRAYLRKRFFREHLSRYSKSRRRAPIYWPLTVPSRSWTVWIYAPMLTREAIYAAAGHAERRHNAADAEIRRLESAQLQAPGPATPGHDPGVARSLAGRLDSERRLAEELRTLHRLLARVAESGWSPDLDDGILVCAAPFAEALLDWPKGPAEIREELRAGKLAWTSAHRWRESL